MRSFLKLLGHSDSARHQSRSLRCWVLALIALCTFSVLLQVPAFGQVASGSLSGTVTDASGAVIPNAKIEMKNEQNGTVRETVSNTVGLFSFAAVQPASYTVTISAPGFASYRVKNIVFNQGENRKLTEIALKPSTSNESVEVVAVSETVPVDTAESRMTRTRTWFPNWESRDVTPQNSSSSCPAWE